MATFTGDNNDNVLIGSTENDQLFGLGGNDLLDGGFGFDQIDGGDGNDTVTYNFFSGSLVSGGLVGIVANLQVAGQTGVVSFPSNGNQSETLTSIENLIGSRGNDSITGSAGSNTLSGGAGNDTLNGRDGVDSLNGGDGDDNVSGNKGDDTMIGGAGNDRLFWIDGDGSDNMSGGIGVDSVEFTGATTVGPSGATKPGNDILTLTRDPASDNVVLRRTGIGLGPITLKIDTTERINISGVEGDDSLTVGSLIGTSVSSVRFSGGFGNDVLDASQDGFATMSIFGDFGNDVLRAGNQSDTMEGGAGSDNLFGNNGNDVLTGVNSGDFVTPGRGEIDILNGGAARDRFVLGDRTNGRRVFYDDGNNDFDGGNDIRTGMDGVSDFAHIVDFVSGLDTIQLVGAPTDYVIRDLDRNGPLSRGTTAQDVGIFRPRSSLLAPDELIAIVQDVGSGTLNLNNTNQFVFV